MREIRFRAWINQKLRMLFVTDLLGVIDLLKDATEFYEIKCTNRKPSGWCNGGTYEINSVELMQYTGLKDKNGKEIYEGDVVEFVYPERKCEVIFKEDLARFQLRYLTEKQQNGDLIKIYCNEITIIGNIYDNPELLGV